MSNIEPILGPLQMNIPNLEWESARAAHVWMTPQRINYVANPSFEVGTSGETNLISAGPILNLSGDANGAFEVEVPIDTYDADGYNWFCLVFDARPENDPLIFDILPQPWITFRTAGWLVATTTVPPTEPVVVRSIAPGVVQTGSLEGTEPVGLWKARFFGLQNVNIYDADALIFEQWGTDVNTGIAAVGYVTNRDGGNSVISDPTNPYQGEHTPSRFIVGIAGRWNTGVDGDRWYQTTFDGLPISITNLPDPSTLGNEHHVSEILTLEMMGVPMDQVYGWRSNGYLEAVSPQVPRPLGPWPRDKAAHLTGGEIVTIGEGGGEGEGGGLPFTVTGSPIAITQATLGDVLPLKVFPVAGSSSFSPSTVLPFIDEHPYVTVNADKSINVVAVPGITVSDEFGGIYTFAQDEVPNNFRLEGFRITVENRTTANDLDAVVATLYKNGVPCKGWYVYSDPNAGLLKRDSLTSSPSFCATSFIAQPLNWDSYLPGTIPPVLVGEQYIDLILETPDTAQAISSYSLAFALGFIHQTSSNFTLRVEPIYNKVREIPTVPDITDYITLSEEVSGNFDEERKFVVDLGEIPLEARITVASVHASVILDSSQTVGYNGASYRPILAAYATTSTNPAEEDWFLLTGGVSGIVFFDPNWKFLKVQWVWASSNTNLIINELLPEEELPVEWSTFDFGSVSVICTQFDRVEIPDEFLELFPDIPVTAVYGYDKGWELAGGIDPRSPLVGTHQTGSIRIWFETVSDVAEDYVVADSEAVTLFSKATTLLEPYVESVNLSATTSLKVSVSDKPSYIDLYQIIINSQSLLNNNDVYAQGFGVGFQTSPRFVRYDNPGDINVTEINHIVLESNLFPLASMLDANLSLEAQVAGVGKVRLGLVFWDLTKQNPTYIVGDWVTVNSNENFHTVRSLVPLIDRCEEAQFRLEFLGEECWVDHVLVDNNEAQLGYFDGEWPLGMDGDFSWYGEWGHTGAVDYGGFSEQERLGRVRHRSFSLYYNNRDNVNGWVFGYTEPVAKEGRVYDLANFTDPDVNGIQERTYDEISDPAPTGSIDENAYIEEARNKLLENGEAAIVITRQVVDEVTGQVSDEPVGQLALTQLTRLQRSSGESWKWVPEGADVIPQWDDVYDFRIASWPGDLFIPVKDVTGTPVTDIPFNF